MSDPELGIYGKVILGITISGLALSVGVLVTCGYLVFFRPARAHLDRVSFRLLVYALVSHVIFEILGHIEPLYVFPGWQCSLLAFLLNFNLLFSASIFFCVGLNLMLVLVYNFNGRMMEKYYIMGSLVLSGACLGSAYAAGRLGPDTRNHLCWYNNENENEMLRWAIGTELVWMLLLSAAELGVFLIIVAFLLPFILDSGGTVARHSTDSESQTRSNTRLTIVRLRGIIVRIGIYPLISCVMNVIGSVLTVWQLKEQADPDPSGPPVLFGLAVYSMRPLVYSMIAATDPSFVRAIRARLEASGSSATQQTTQVPVSVCLSTFVDLTVESSHGAGSDYLGVGSQTQVENSSLNPTENTIGVSLATEKAKSIRKDEMEDVGASEPVAGPSSAAQWDVARQI
ncbi:hypothetical protein FB45DRAFT_1063559 [Roridomyces roridus]|uniref:Uncharacterized protein n=1 Tax=Roridomyces roridus TaxID=1738132 RepID=A0AAD7FG08_9AGAR|nr:hypothetical protein FB45DRAFT_1063559 [Roridomyces roridus]